MKSYEIKIYTHNGNYKRTLKMSDIISDISFSETINGGQGNLNIELKGDSTHYICGDIVEVRETDTEVDTNVYPCYTGIIKTIESDEYLDFEKIELEVVGIFTLLGEVLYSDTGNYNFSKNDTPGNIVKNIIDNFNLKYGNLSENQNLGSTIFYYDTDVDITGSSIHMEFNYISCLQALQNIVKGTEFYFFISPSGKITFKKVGEQKRLTFKREIVSIKNSRKNDSMVNMYFLQRSGGTIKIYPNTTSISNFNLKEKFESRTEIQNVGTQDIVGDTEVQVYGVENKNVILSLKPQISPFLFPGMEISTQNTKNVLQNLRITKIEKRKNVWNLYFGDFTSFGKTILSK